jgi:peptidyl-tRNA hydrolase
MRIQHLTEHRQGNILLESFGLEKDQYNTYWVNEIHPLLMEVALSPEQIKQLFKSIETTASEQGSNRTAAGKAVDKAGEITDKVKDLWFNKLGTALQQSGPVQAFDAKYEEIKNKIAAENPKLAEALGKYKQFADTNPKLQKFLMMVAASIAGSLGLAVAGGAAAGIAATGLGVGAGVAIVNIVDRLLKGEKASTAIGRGATAGIVAGLTAAGVKAASEMFNSIANSFKPGQEYHEIMLGNPPRKVLINAEDGEMLAKLHQDAMSQMKGQDVADLLSSGGATPGLDKYLETAAEVAQRASDPAYQQAIADAAGAALDTTVGLDILQANAAEAAKTIAPIAGAVAGQVAGGAGEKEKKESYYVQTRPLSEGQVYLLLKKISEQQELTEGPMDLLKKGAGKVAGAVGKGLSAVGKQITTNATYPKLLAAWKLEGSPTDSEEIKKFLQNYGGITPETIDKVYGDMKLATGAASGQDAAAAAGYKEVKKLIQALDKKGRQRMMTYIQKQMGTA